MEGQMEKQNEVEDGKLVTIKWDGDQILNDRMCIHLKWFKKG